MQIEIKKRMGVCLTLLGCAAMAVAQTGVSTSGTTTVGTVPVFGPSSNATVTNSPIAISGSSVGIGTSNQFVNLNVNGEIQAVYPGVVGPDIEWSNPSKTTNGTANRWDIYNMTGGYGNSLQFWDYDTIGCGTGGMCNPRLTLMDNGNVGIGTTSPTYTLDVAGAIHSSGAVIASGGVKFPDGSTQTTAFNPTLCGGDYAEAVNAAESRKNYEPGDVLVIAKDDAQDVLKSNEPYSTLVAGIYSTKPGVIGRRQSLPKGPEEIPMAMVGIVPTKVTTENGPIHKGDLLVSSSLQGYAMKGTDRGRMLGAVIGKAMGSLDAGTGIIEVLVTLQ